MPSLGTFGSFGIATSGIYAASAALNVTGNNIANINTTGYCRQTLDLSAMRTGGADQYASSANLYFGSGVKTDSISHYRDPYLDIRYRNENTNCSELEAWSNSLDELARILDEVAKGDGDFGIIEAQFNDLMEQLQNLSEKAGSEEYDTLVRSSADTLAKLFNSYATQLETVEINALNQFVEDVDAVNALLTNIRDMNEQIWKCDLHGDPALILRDQRNLLIDELSGYIGIDVTYTTEVLGMVTEAQNLTITIAGTDIELVNGLYATQLTLPEEVPTPNPDYDENDLSTMQWLDDYGYPTNNPNFAAIARNDTGQMIDDYGNVVTNASDAALLANPSYVEKIGQYLDADGNPTDDIDEAAPMQNPQAYDYIAENGTYTNDPNEAAVRLNPDYPDTDATNQYLDKDGSPTNVLTEGCVLNPDHVDSITDLYLTADGTATNDPTLAAVQLNPNYDPAAYLYLDEDGNVTNDAYLDSDGNPTWERYAADGTENTLRNPLTNNVDGATNNYYLFELEPLVNKNGEYRYTDERRRLSDSILLTDIVLSGRLQAEREFLTEEGEFASDFDVGLDPDATTKRGVRYYKYALDSLALQFSNMMNESNTLNPYELFGINSNGEFMDYNQDPLTNDYGKIELDSSGNPIYPALTVMLADGTTTYITMDNVYDDIPAGSSLVTGWTDDDPPVAITTPIDLTETPTFEHLLYQEGGQPEYFKTNGNGEYVRLVVDENNKAILDGDGNYQYEVIMGYVHDSNGNVIMENLVDDEGWALDTDGNRYVEGVSTGYMLTPQMAPLTSSNLYDGNYQLDSGDNIFVDADGTPITDGTPLGYLLTNNIDLLLTDGVTQSVYTFTDMYKNNGTYYLDSNGNYLQDVDGNPLAVDDVAADPYLFEYLQDVGVLEEAYSNFQKSGVLISNNSNGDDGTGITAKNIAISRSWSIGETRIVLAKGSNVGSSQNSNVIDMINKFDADMSYKAQDVVADASDNKNEFFKGSFQKMLINTVSTLAQDQKTTNTMLTSSTVTVLALDNSRISVSGVDLNEEAANMMIFQQSYTASARLLTTLDTVIETLLNCV